MASVPQIFRILIALFVALFLSQCEKKSTTITEPPKPEISSLKGRVEFLKEHEKVLNIDIPKQVQRRAYSGRVIVRYREGMKTSSLSNLQINGIKARDDVSSVAKTEAYSTSYSVIRKDDQLGFSAQEVEKVVETFEADESVEYAVPEYLRTWMGLANPNDTNFKYQWALNENFIDIGNEAWADIFDSTSGKEIRVAVVDTGYRPHDDLDENIRKDLSYDFVSDPDLEADVDRGIDNDATDIDDNPDAAVFYHGTFVAGIISAVKNNAKGIAGLAPNVKIIHVRVLGKGGYGGDLDIEQGIRYAAGLPNNSGRILGENEKAHVINLSLGGPVQAPGIHRAIRDAVSSGTPVVCAAGNEGTSSPTYPAAYDECISVGALGPTGAPFTQGAKPYKLAAYSNWGINVDITAPGGSGDPFREIDGIPEGVISTYWRSNRKCNIATVSNPSDCSSYQPSAGTSFAAPHASGVIALMRAVNPKLSPLGIASVLFRTAVDDNDSEPLEKYFGYGIVNALSAVETAKSVAKEDEKVIVKLLNPADGSEFKKVVILGSSDFRFEFSDVPAGDYFLQAGTDYDNDGIICEKGEKFGVFPDSSSSRVFKIGIGKNDIVINIKSVRSDEDCK